MRCWPGSKRGCEFEQSYISRESESALSEYPVRSVARAQSIKTNSGVLSFTGGGANSFTGTTTVSQGTLLLDKNGLAIVGPLVIGDGTGGANSDRCPGPRELTN
jgi:autotransporter-associated beta strand protein